MKFKDIYEVPKFKNLDGVGKIIFVFSFLLPALILYTFLHLYFWPFGLDKTYSLLEDKELSLSDTKYIYTVDEQELLDGIAMVTLDTSIPLRNLRTYIEVEGENVFLIPEVFSENSINFTASFERNFDENFDYKLIDDYTVKNENIVVFKLDYVIDPNEQKNNELLLKFENLRIIQNENSVRLSIQKKEGGEIKTYTTQLGLSIEEENEIEEIVLEEEKEPYPVTIYAIYKKPTETNGFIEIFAENKLSHRTIIPSEKKEDFEKVENILNEKTIWNDEFEKDINQEFISLKQEEYTKELIGGIPEDFRDLVDLNLYYEKLFKKEDLDEEENNISLINGCIFEYSDDFVSRLHIFYKKAFFRNFTGTIKNISVGYEYPIVLRKEFGTLRNTPAVFKIVGENSKIEDVKINIHREPIWEKL